MSSLGVAARTVDEGTTWRYRCRLEDEDHVAIPVANVTTLTMTVTLTDSDSTVVNSLDAQDVLNDGTFGTYAESNGTITAATNASPIVITSAAHGLSRGDIVYITGVLGNTAANGYWVVDNPATNTFELNEFTRDENGEIDRYLSSSGNGAWTSGGTWSHSLFTVTLRAADNVIAGSGVAIRKTEEHSVVFEAVYTTGAKNWEVPLFVKNLRSV